MSVTFGGRLFASVVSERSPKPAQKLIGCLNAVDVNFGSKLLALHRLHVHQADVCLLLLLGVLLELVLRQLLQPRNVSA